jgi:hypothetical protein
MSWVYLIAESVICCILFTVVVVYRLLKDPVSFIMSYPPAIRKRVATLPEYAPVFKKRTKKQIALKIFAGVIISVLLGCFAYFSGARTFLSAFIYVFTIFFIVNLYDLIVLDILFFCRNRKVIIKGTEDMINEYRSPKHHIIAGLKAPQSAYSSPLSSPVLFY